MLSVTLTTSSTTMKTWRGRCKNWHKTWVGGMVRVLIVIDLHSFRKHLLIAKMLFSQRAMQSTLNVLMLLQACVSNLHPEQMRIGRLRAKIYPNQSCGTFPRQCSAHLKLTSCPAYVCAKQSEAFDEQKGAMIRLLDRLLQCLERL